MKWLNVIIWDNISLYHKRERRKSCISLLSNTPYQFFLKCWWTDFKMYRSVGFQLVDLTKVVIIGNRKGIDETSLCPHGEIRQKNHTFWKKLPFGSFLMKKKKQSLRSSNTPQTRLHATFTVWPQPIWKKVRSWWQIPPQHQSTYLGGPESASIEIPPSLHKFFKSCYVLWSKCCFTMFIFRGTFTK